MLDHIDEIGGPLHENHYPVGWAWAGLAVPVGKQVASHFGGTRNGLVVSWPKRIADPGGLRTQFHHVIDIAPTISSAPGIAVPSVVDGAPSSRSKASASPTRWTARRGRPSRRTTQYFEMFGNRAIYRDGWVAAARHGRLPWLTVGSVDFSEDRWELYDTRSDFSQADDLAAKHPDKLRELQAVFLEEARRYQVLPLDDRFVERADPSAAAFHRLRAHGLHLLRRRGPHPRGLGADREGRIAPDRGQPVDPSVGRGGRHRDIGGTSGGYALFVQGTKLIYVYNDFGRDRTTLTSSIDLPAGDDVLVAFEFHADGPTPGAPGTGRLLVNGQPVAEGRVANRVPYRNSATESFDVGRDTGTAVIAGLYQVPFAFTGALKRLDFTYLD